MKNPQTLLGEQFAWEPVEYGIVVPNGQDILAHGPITPEQHEWGVRLARTELAAHARRHHIAIESIREHRTTGRTVVYFEGVKVLHAERAERLRQVLAGERG